mmetsp:Transcript_2506/g.4715  ORF Transcript_2506/g.4715 Transcript_2506/m.4715 type:complete len:219 (-) Transcript_2506:220-876(-)
MCPSPESPVWGTCCSSSLPCLRKSGFGLPSSSRAMPAPLPRIYGRTRSGSSAASSPTSARSPAMCLSTERCTSCCTSSAAQAPSLPHWRCSFALFKPPSSPSTPASSGLRSSVPRLHATYLKRSMPSSSTPWCCYRSTCTKSDIRSRCASLRSIAGSRVGCFTARQSSRGGWESCSEPRRSRTCGTQCRLSSLRATTLLWCWRLFWWHPNSAYAAICW